MKLAVFLLLIVSFLAFNSCAVKDVSFSTSIDFKSKDDSYRKHKKKRYRVSIPKGYKKVLIEGSHEKEVQFIYPDSSIIYLSENLQSGSYTNWRNLESVADKAYDYLYMDTVRNQGLTENGYWKELKLKNIIIGYLNVPSNKLDVYDKSLESIR